MRPKMMHFRVRLHMNPRRAEKKKTIAQNYNDKTIDKLKLLYTNLSFDNNRLFYCTTSSTPKADC